MSEMKMDSHKSIKPVTIDFRKSGYEDLYQYIKEYSDKHCHGKMAAGVLDIIRDHQQAGVSRSDIFVVQGNRIIAKV